MTDEPPELVEEWIRVHRPTYPIVSTKGGQLEAFLKVRGFPTVAVIAPDGRLSYVGHGGESRALKEALGAADKGAQFPPKLAKPVQLMREQDQIESYKELRKLLDKGLEGEDAEGAERLRVYLEDHAASVLKDAGQRLEDGLVYQALERATPYAEAEPAFPASADCKGLVARIEELPALEDELKGGDLHKKALEAEDEFEFTDAVETYRKIVKKYPDSRIATVAEARAQELIKEGKPGYKRACNSCRKAKKACEKHLEEV